MVWACSKVTCPATFKWKDVADPDMVGFGVLLAFITPAFAVMVVAYLSHALPKSQYAAFDDKLISKLKSTLDKCKWMWRFLEPYPKIWSLPRIIRYEALLLTLSDQALITTIAILVATYSQICSLSNFTFRTCIGLSYFAASVHTLTLTALKEYFAKHETQAKVRLVSMFIVTIFQTASVFLFNIIEASSIRNYAICDIAGPDAPWSHVIWASVAESYIISYGLYRGMFQVYELYEQEQPLHAWVLGLLRLAYRDDRFQEDREELLRLERRRLGQSHFKQMYTLQQRLGGVLMKMRIVAPKIGMDFTRSTFYSLSASTLFTIWLAVTFVNLLVAQSKTPVKVSSLLEPKFGQIMPILLLLVFVFSFMEASGLKVVLHACQS
ncbi:hypothetical protein K456DRAFT_482235 [Colletotrichum gloeosporioides 23]|nr:hypothetical protein K456DRAFT_482235 [Colletotrichum gloeosporioides 23]